MSGTSLSAGNCNHQRCNYCSHEQFELQSVFLPLWAGNCNDQFFKHHFLWPQLETLKKSGHHYQLDTVPISAVTMRNSVTMSWSSETIMIHFPVVLRIRLFVCHICDIPIKFAESIWSDHIIWLSVKPHYIDFRSAHIISTFSFDLMFDILAVTSVGLTIMSCMHEVHSHLGFVRVFQSSTFLFCTGCY